MMVVLTDAEVAFVKANPIGRLATASPAGEPDVAPVLCIFRRSLGLFVMGSRDAERTRRHHNARRNPRASLVFDDLTWEPYQPRGVKLTGSIAVHQADEQINLGTWGAGARRAPGAEVELGHRGAGDRRGRPVLRAPRRR